MLRAECALRLCQIESGLGTRMWCIESGTLLLLSWFILKAGPQLVSLLKRRRVMVPLLAGHCMLCDNK